MTETDGSGAPAEAPEQTQNDRRRFRRVAVSLPGRYMLEDGSEHPCVCIDVSVGGVRLRAAQSGPWGSRVIAYIEGLGRLEGYIVRRAPGWFALESRTTARKGERVEERIAWIMGADDGKRERRGPSRQFVRQGAALSTLDGRQYLAQITDISKEGAAVLTDAVLEVGERVRLESRRGRVVRQFPGGLALQLENWVDEPRGRREPGVPVSEPRARRA
jgi:PilZ domain-containing protein